ncbi:MAG: hypothetical protein MJ249_16825 [Kiritimatiellae bacterium]|nr:hypothetical protein [Kiritimatiellia bacterium]
MTDFVRANGTEAEKANLANYKDAIVTAKNVRVLKDKVGKALANRPAFPSRTPPVRPEGARGRIGVPHARADQFKIESNL